MQVSPADTAIARKWAAHYRLGCIIILKASEEAPVGAVQLVQAFVDAGLPPSVLNLVFGKPSDIFEYLIPRQSVRLVTCTAGSAQPRAQH